MVIGTLLIKERKVVKNNPFYGDYVIKKTFSKEFINEKTDGLSYPKHGMKLEIEDFYNNQTTFFFGRFFYTGEPNGDENTTYSTSFGYEGSIYEVEVDADGYLIRLDKWYNSGDYEDGDEPDCTYQIGSNGVKYELFDK